MSKLNSNDTYLIFNYNPSAVAVSTKDTSYLIPGGSSDSPATVSFTLNEIRFINNGSRVFKIGALLFDPEIEEAMYEELHIGNWRDILRDADIEKIILEPTVEGLERILAITDKMYFERVYGIYIGLKNSGVPISGKVEGLMKERRKELSRGKARTQISVRKVEPENVATAAQIQDLQAQLEELKKLLAAQNAEVATIAEPTKTATTHISETKTEKPAAKPRQTKTTKGG